MFDFVYQIVIFFIRVYYILFFGIEICNKENLPKSGGYVISANHTSNHDGPVIGSFLPRRMNYLAKAELFETKLGNWFLRGIGVIPIVRGGSDLATLRTIIKLLKSGGVISVFPEGTRSKVSNDELKPGAVLFSIKAHVPIVPVAIITDYKFFHKIKVVYGEPIYYTDYYDKKVNQQTMHDLTVELMQKIYSMVGTA